MPKYNVSKVLEIIKNLTAEEKREIQQQLPNVLSTTTTPFSPTHSESMSGISISGSSGVEVSQIQAEEGSRIVRTKTDATIQNTDLQAALESLKQLKLNVAESEALNLVEKKTVEVPIETLETELKKPKPDKSLIDQAVEALKKGLAGVEALEVPVKRVAKLIAEAWMAI